MNKNDASLPSMICAAPAPGKDRAVAAAKFSELKQWLDSDASAIKAINRKTAKALILGIAEHSRYLWRLIEQNPQTLARFLSGPADAILADSLATARKLSDSAMDDESVMRILRKMKQEAHLLIALADIGGVWNVERVIAAITEMADVAVSCAIAYMLRQAAQAGKLNLPDAGNPEGGCGLVVLGLGKHGAGELNYSSDIDLVVFYDPESSTLAPDVEPGPLFVRMTRTLVRLLQERTEDGYVLRVDLRLRPDPGSTAVAISLPAAFDYYESFGQNWERAAFIKARPVAGDIALGERFLSDLVPFVWRKYFDYAAIADIHAMKRQIHAVRGHSEIAIAGHDVKLGRGGIREIEFFVQTQQLIFGGRRNELRGRKTLDMLAALQDDGWVTSDAQTGLTAAYGFLRTIEHRLQMVNDEQTQRLPADHEILEQFSRFCGYDTIDDFGAALTEQLECVERHYARLFEHAPGLDSAAGSLVFTGSSDDPDTLTTLEKYGFHEPSLAIETIRGWHFGRRAAVQSARAREVLTELVPALIESFSGSGDPDAALAAFDNALGRMPAAIELFSILKSNAAVRDLFGDILGGAPRLAQIVAQRPHVLDAAIDPDLPHAILDSEQFDARLHRAIAAAPATEDVLDNTRNIFHEETFLISVQALSGAIDATRTGKAFTMLAQSIISALLSHVRDVFARDHGEIPGAECAIIGMGKLGSFEMTATSDLDIVLVYDFDDEKPESDGPRPLHAAQYFGRLAQRLISALTVATRRGSLYEVDMRLRPSGRQGPLAARLSTFQAYQKDEAEFWEHMALSRSRIIAGGRNISKVLEATIQECIRQPRDETVLKTSIRDMRKLIATEKGEDDSWDLKLVSGGLMDIEFIAQYFVLKHGPGNPEILSTQTAEILNRIGERGLADLNHTNTLIEAHALYSAVIQMTRLAVPGKFDPGQVAAGVLRRIAAAANCPDFKMVEGSIKDMRQAVRDIFNTILK